MQSDQQQDLQRKGGVEELEVQLSQIGEHKRLCCFQAPILTVFLVKSFLILLGICFETFLRKKK